MDQKTVEETDLCLYFGDSNSLGTGYLYLYTASDFESSTVLQTIMPETWSPRVEVSTPASTPSGTEPPVFTPLQNAFAVTDKDPNTVPPPTIIATQALDADEEDGEEDFPDNQTTLAVVQGEPGPNSLNRIYCATGSRVTNNL
eukprot:jgi/Hompol1/2504/HPOL_006029-RA